MSRLQTICHRWHDPMLRAMSQSSNIMHRDKYNHIIDCSLIMYRCTVQEPEAPAAGPKNRPSSIHAIQRRAVSPFCICIRLLLFKPISSLSYGYAECFRLKIQKHESSCNNSDDNVLLDLWRETYEYRGLGGPWPLWPNSITSDTIFQADASYWRARARGQDQETLQLY